MITAVRTAPKTAGGTDCSRRVIQKEGTDILKRKISILCLLALLLGLFGPACSAEDSSSPEAVPDLEVGIREIENLGNIILSIGPDSMRELGYEPADIILVSAGAFEMEMPIGEEYTDVDSGQPICCMRPDKVVLAINAGNLASAMGIAAGGQADAPALVLSMKEKQAYAQELTLHQLSGKRTNSREDYRQLSDEEYANFRAVETTGMGTGTLFRSSSPVNPELNRNEEADEALLRSLVRTVMNMADSEETLTSYADYGLTSYSACDIIALDMDMDWLGEEFQQKLAEGFRFLASHEGPYLIHCLEGKDRTGFAAAILECLMGAGADEVIEDYMLTYRNYYGIEPGTPQYQRIAEGNIAASLSRVFGIPSIQDEDVNLSACANAFLEKIGMTSDEISSLKENLSRDYGGLA